MKNTPLDLLQTVESSIAGQREENEMESVLTHHMPRGFPVM